MMKRILFAIATMLLLVSRCRAQSVDSFNSFLLSAHKDELVAVQRDKLYHFNALNFNLPYVRNLEVRTETNGYDLAQQEYLLRLTPNSIRSVRSQRQYRQAIKHITETELDLAHNLALKERYGLLVNYFHKVALLKVKRQYHDLLSDQILFFRRSMALEEFEILDLLKAADAEQKLSREILDLENERNRLQSLIFSGETNVVSDSLLMLSLPSVEDVVQNMRIIEDQSSLKHPELEVLSAQLYSLMLAHEVESISSKFSLGYLQVEYGFDQGESFGNQISIGAGFDLPLKQSNSIVQNRLKVEVLESRSAYQRAVNDIEESLSADRYALLNAIEKYRLVSSQFEKGDAEFVLHEYRKIADVSPIAILKLREITLGLEILLCNHHFDVLEQYLEYIDVKGFLSRKPFYNYLSSGLIPLNN